MNTKTKKNIVIISVLILIFAFYNFFIYTSERTEYTIKFTPEALKGQVLWQNNNCWSCHQIYGLGGYLGPDLTNISSDPKKGKNYIKGFLNSGIKSMPKFNFSENEKEAIAVFLEQIDRTGYFPNANAIIKPNGWVELNYKNEK
jgi:nitric oxide reductase subunit C